MASYTRRPEWLKLGALEPTILNRTAKLTRDLKLHTVCESARCPNRTKCFAEGTATFMILGNVCTRNCTFCAVKYGQPQAPDPQESDHIVQAVDRLGLRYVVVTSVTRDDLPDGGSSQFAQTIRAIRKYDPNIAVEVLIPDFQGSASALQTVVHASPAVLNHNIETVPRLYSEVRPQAKYRRSLDVLKQAKLLDNSLLTKSGLMLGLGESQEEVIEVMADLRQVGCDLLTIGQYLQPSLEHHKLVRYIRPEEFEEYQIVGRQLGFVSTMSGPLVRSSFHAAEMHISATRKSKHKPIASRSAVERLPGSATH
ncbi:MAG TPA: lipoyl synthase [Dehalococcoidia bacterium]|nr:lipoyl synthase [Dehalococcoidia bacterium]